INPRTHDKSDHVQDDDGPHIGGARHGAKTSHERGRRNARRPPHRHCLVGDRAEQRDGEKSMDDQQRRPEDHDVSPTTPSVVPAAPKLRSGPVSRIMPSIADPSWMLHPEWMLHPDAFLNWPCCPTSDTRVAPSASRSSGSCSCPSRSPSGLSPWVFPP